ncbi:MAG: helix-turn-helix domain-containing protein [Hyphomicrobiales bacterium]
MLDDLRKDLALRYISQEELQLIDVAFLLGYANQSAFTNAFKRWTGKTPRQARISALK